MPLEDRFIYQPTRVGHVVGFGTDMPLTAADGVKLHALFFFRAYAYFNLLYLHGSRGALPHHRAALGTLAALGANILAIDYRGYGKSEGEPSEAGLYADARAGYDWCVQQAGPKAVIVVGEGLGTAPACQIAATCEIGGLVLVSPFTNLRELAASRYPWLPTSWVVRSQFDNLAKLPQVTAPVAIVHSRADERVPFDHAERLFAAANTPKQPLWLDDVEHSELFSHAPQPIVEGLKAFIATLDVPS